MRVVFLTHNYPRHAGDVAGGFLHPLARELRDRDIDVRVVAPADRGAGGTDVLDGVPVRRVRYAAAERETLAYTGRMSEALRSPGGLLALGGMIRALRQAARDEVGSARDTVIHAHWWVPAGVAAPSDHPTVITCHGTDVRLLEGNPFIRGLGRRVLRRAAVVTTVSAAMAEVIARRTGRVIPEAMIQPMPVATVARARSTGGGGVVVLGRLSAQKRIDLALDAIAELRRRGVTTQLTVVGDGPAREALERHAAAIGLGAEVDFQGEVAPERVPDALRTADCLLMTARQEGLGLAAAEALMQGIPVVACDDGGGVLDVVPRGAGGRVVRAEAGPIADAVREVLDSSTDRDGAWQAGQRWRERLSSGFVATRCLDWYRQALDA